MIDSEGPFATRSTKCDEILPAHPFTWQHATSYSLHNDKESNRNLKAKSVIYFDFVFTVVFTATMYWEKGNGTHTRQEAAPLLLIVFSVVVICSKVQTPLNSEPT